MSLAEVVLLTANAVYGTAYVTMRPAVEVAGLVAPAPIVLGERLTQREGWGLPSP